MHLPSVLLLRPILLISIVASLGGLALRADELSPLRIVGSASGREFTSVIAKTGALLFTDEAGVTQPLPHNTCWRLEGNLRDNARSVLFSPPYRIVTYTALPFSLEKPTSSLAVVRLNRSWQWPDPKLMGATAVFVWIVDGRPAHVIAAATSTRDGPSGFVSALALFTLDATTVKGFPVVLLTKNGRWIEPERRFGNSPEGTAFWEMHFDSIPQFQASLEKLQKIDIRSEAGSRWRLLQFAAEAGIRGAVIHLHKMGSDLDAHDANGTTALHLAAHNGRDDIVDALLTAGARRSPSDDAGQTPFEAAVENGHLNTARILLGEKISADGLRDALELAVTRVDASAIDALLAHGATRFLRRLPDATFDNVLAIGDAALIRRLSDGGMRASARPRPAPSPAAEDAATLEAARIHDVAELTQAPKVRKSVSPEFLLGPPGQAYESSAVFGDAVAGTSTVPARANMRNAMGQEPAPRPDHWAAVTLIVEPDGSPTHVQVVDANTEQFRKAVEKAVRQYRFEPGYLNGTPVRTRLTRTIVVD